MEDLLIRKDNRIVQKTINKFTYKQNQLMALLLGKYVNLKSQECIDTEITIEELRKALDIKSDGGNFYERMRIAIEKFGENSSVGIYTEKKGKPKYVWMPYFTKIELTETEVSFKWNNEMKPFLTNLKENYTQYLSNDYLKLKSVYSQNLYEQLKSLENFKKKYGKDPIIPLEEIRNFLQIKNEGCYKEFKRLNDLIIKKAVKEINEVTDLNVSYETQKKGRKVVAIVFDIKRKNWNYKKKQKENIPEWYNQTQATMPSDNLLDQVKALQEQMFEPENIND